MKVACESCGAQYDLDERRIPPSGITMKCPACLHQFMVKKPGAGAPPPPSSPPPKREVALSAIDEEPDLPAPKSKSTRSDPNVKIPGQPTRADSKVAIPLATKDVIDLPGPVATKTEDLIDLPGPKVDPLAPKAAKAPLPPPPRVIPSDTPTAKLSSPAPARPSAAPPIVPPPVRPPPGPPPAVASPPAMQSPPPKPRESSTDLPAPKAAAKAAPPPLADLPAPKASPPPKPRESAADLVAPKRSPAPPSLLLDTPGETDVVAPKRPNAVDLDAPDPEDAIALELAPKTMPQLGTLGDDVGPPPIDDGFEAIDVVAPKSETLDIAPKSETLDIAPKQETMDVAPVPEATDVAPKSQAYADRSLDEATPVEAPKADPRAPDREVEAPAGKRRVPRALLFGGAALVVVVGVGVGLGVFTQSGYFGANLFTNKRAEAEGKLQAARKLLADDVLGSYRKAALELQPLVEENSKLVDAFALKAQSHFAVARLGVPAEVKTGDALLARVDQLKPQPEPPDVAKARALKSLATGKLAEGRTQLAQVLASAPSDASALVYLGWVELAAGDAEAADKAFGKAQAAEQGRAAALHGAGLARETLGDLPAAIDLYNRALARSPQHFGAALGAARAGARKGQMSSQSAQSKIEDMIAKRGAALAPREIADGWASVGLIAAQAGRRDEAEDRLKRALALDAQHAAARVALSEVQCASGRAKEAVEPLGKLLAAQPKNLDARLALARALVESGRVQEVPKVLEPAVAQAPKDARVSYWLGRLVLAQEKPDREKALALFKDAIAADPKFIAAYVDESNTFAALGKPDDALDALKQAELRASDDPEMMVDLGRAFLGIGRAADGEARFRAALDKKPAHAGARIQLGAALEAQNKLDDAYGEYVTVQKAEPDFPGLAERIARLLSRQGKKAEAWEQFQKALKQGIPTQALRMAVAQLGLELGKPDEARTLADSVLKEDDRSAPAHLVMARAAMAAGRAEEALTAARRSATIADLPEAHLVLGQALEKLAKYDQSMVEYNLARRGPTEGDAAIGRARILVRMGATRDALSELAVLQKDARFRTAALLLAGDCQSDLGEKDKARNAYEAAVKSAAPGSEAAGEAGFKLGRALADAGKRKPAVDALERALKAGAGDKASYAAEAWLLIGDGHRELRQNDAAVKAYKRYLELAPADARASRAEVERQIANLGGK